MAANLNDSFYEDEDFTRDEGDVSSTSNIIFGNGLAGEEGEYDGEGKEKENDDPGAGGDPSNEDSNSATLLPILTPTLNLAIGTLQEASGDEDADGALYNRALRCRLTPAKKPSAANTKLPVSQLTLRNRPLLGQKRKLFNALSDEESSEDEGDEKKKDKDKKLANSGGAEKKPSSEPPIIPASITPQSSTSASRSLFPGTTSSRSSSSPGLEIMQQAGVGQCYRLAMEVNELREEVDSLTKELREVRNERDALAERLRMLEQKGLKASAGEASGNHGEMATNEENL